MQKGLDGHLCTATSAVVDPALLAKVDTNRRVSRCFDLRMSEFVTAGERGTDQKEVSAVTYSKKKDCVDSFFVCKETAKSTAA